MTTVQTTDKPKTPNTPAKNGTSPAATAPTTEAKPGDAAESPEATAEAKEAKKRGVLPTMPAAIVYRHQGRVYASIHNPVDGSDYTESGKGEGAAMGGLIDSGFRLSSLSLDGHDWLAAKLPAGAELIGYASIKGFPLPAK